MTRAETALVDFSAARPAAATLAADGFRGIIGYLKPPQAGGAAHAWELRPADLANYGGAGLLILAVYESTGTTWTGGAAAGVTDGRTAVARARAIGYTGPIFGAVDSDPGAQLTTAAQYLAAFTDTVGAAGGFPYPGGYGGRAVIETLAEEQPDALRWQTAGWSGGVLSAAAHLYQRTVRYWPAVAGTDENVVCAPLPAMGGRLLPGGAIDYPTPPAPAPGFDAVAWVANNLRGKIGATGQVWQLLQDWANGTFPSYCHITPTAASYGPQTAAFLANFAHRAALDPALPADVRALLAGADGANVGRGLSYALAHYGLGAYLSARGFRG